MRILIATVKVPFVRGGADLLAAGLEAAFRAAGHATDVIALPFKWYPAERIVDQMLGCRLFDLTEFSGVRVDRLVGLKFPAYLIPHPQKVLWLLHQHRQAYDLWNHPEAGDLQYSPSGSDVRSAIQTADKRSIPQARATYTISKNVSDRLLKFCGIPSTPLYHPPVNADLFHASEAESYLFFPSRLDDLKRQKLVLEALTVTRHPVSVRFAGAAASPAYLDELRKLTRKSGLNDRVSWLGEISEEEKIRQYAACLAVLFPSMDEDYGYVTLEAMLASKPVVTCDDSGGPNEFVAHGETGLTTRPDPQALAEAMDRFWEDRALATRMGRAGRDLYQSMDISWHSVVEALIA